MKLPDGTCEHSVPGFGRDGVIVRVFDLNLNPIENFILRWGASHSPIGTSDLIFLNKENVKYSTIQMDGPISKLTMFEFDKDKKFIGKKVLVPNNIWMEGHPRTIYSDGFYYISFWGKSLLDMFNKRVSKDSYVAVFNDKFELVELLRLTGFSKEDKKEVLIKPSQYACKIEDNIYTAISFSTKQKPDYRIKGQIEKAILVKYKLSDSSGGSGPQIPSLEDLEKEQPQETQSQKYCGDGICDGPETPETVHRTVVEERI